MKKTLKNYVRPSVLRKRLAQIGIKTRVVYYDKEHSTLGTLARCVYKLEFKGGLFTLWSDVNDEGTSWRFAIYHNVPSNQADPEEANLIVEETDLELVLIKFGSHLGKLAEQFQRLYEELT